MYIFLPKKVEAGGQSQMSLEEHLIPAKKPVLVSSLACTSVSTTKYFTGAKGSFCSKKM